jgi:ATP-dependent DNA helicase RecG
VGKAEVLSSRLKMAIAPFSYPEGEDNFDANFIRSLLTDLCSQPTESLESDTVEIKGWCRDEKELAEKLGDVTACLANAEGGLLLIGISDERGRQKFSPCPYPNITRQWLTARIHELTYPPVECHVQDVSDVLSQVLSTAGRAAFAISIPKKKCFGSHLTAKGVSRIRVGRDCRPHFTAEEDYSKILVVDLSEQELSLGAIEFGMSQHARHFGNPRQWAEPWEFLAQARLIERYLPDEERLPRFRIPLATLLLFGKQSAIHRYAPQFETIVTVGNSTTRLKKNIVESVREICAPDGPVMSALSPFAESNVLKELLVNAYIHRCYRIPGPVVVHASQAGLEIQSPGELVGGLQVNDLINCIPVYRNLLLSEGARFVGLCDKIGHGIDFVYKSVLSGGLPFPEFESEHGQFVARVPLDGSAEFGEFLRKRSQALTQLEEIIALRMLWTRETANLSEIAGGMQRGKDVAGRVLRDMQRKLMVEEVGHGSDLFKLQDHVRHDIKTIFHSDQLSFDRTLWGN